MAGQPKLTLSAASALLLVLTAWMASSPPAVADQAQARSLFKAMTDYVGAQQSISFDYDATLEVVTKDRQKLQLASSGTVSLARPDKIRTTRSGGFVDMETVFDGKTLTLFGKNKNVYTRVEVPGSLDNLMNELQKKYDRPLPAADLFFTRAYDEITADVTDVKDLGSGVVGGIECDYFAFRAKDVDWQIWVTQGAKPRPCRYVITSARASSVVGTSKPRALAVLRLMISSNLVACWTGSSAGLAPLRMRSIYPAARRYMSMLSTP